MWKRFMARLLKEAKIEDRFTEHDLRAKCASDAETLERAKQLLGHSDYADGTIDLYFGPKAPKGMESNWLRTGEDFFLIFRLYGPGPALFDKTWKLPDAYVPNFRWCANPLSNGTLSCDRLDGNLRASGERETGAGQDILQRVAVQCRHEIAMRISKN